MSWNLPKLIASLLLLFILASPVFAGLAEDLDRNKSEQRHLQNLINDAKNKENTLSTQISKLNNEIRLTQLQIDAKQSELDILSADISTLTIRVTNLEADLDNLARIAVRRFRTGQALQAAAPIGSVVIGGDFKAATTNLAYLEYIEHKDQTLFAEMKALKSSLSVQKLTLEDRQAEVAKLKNELAAARSELDGQKAAKVQILRVTQNDEARYKKMLEAAKKEAEQIILAYNNKGGSRWVRKGEPIGTEGYSGYVYPKNIYGTHLHFGLYNESYRPAIYYQSVDPCRVLSCRRNGEVGTVSSGQYQVPIRYNGTDYADVSQWWGWTWFARSGGYGGGGHTGIDMVTYFGDIVYAAQEGQAYFSRGGQEKGNGVFIYHPDGKTTLYWHLN